MRTVLIANGILVSPTSLEPADVFIVDGKVQSLCPRGSAPAADTVIDATGRYVLPGLIDAHNHPVYADRIGTLSQAALASGVTTIIPYIGSVKAWGQKGRSRPGHQKFHRRRRSLFLCRLFRPLHHHAQRDG